jgi:hypothetical protein
MMVKDMRAELHGSLLDGISSSRLGEITSQADVVMKLDFLQVTLGHQLKQLDALGLVALAIGQSRN